MTLARNASVPGERRRCAQCMAGDSLYCNHADGTRIMGNVLQWREPVRINVPPRPRVANVSTLG